jgi:hypothetical protein
VDLLDVPISSFRRPLTLVLTDPLLLGVQIIVLSSPHACFCYFKNSWDTDMNEEWMNVVRSLVGRRCHIRSVCPILGVSR